MCLATGAAGADAAALYADPDLLGHVYAGPYAVRHPEHGFVVVAPMDTGEAGVAGYVLAAPDTRAFEAWQEQNWYPALREQYPPRDTATPDAAIVRLLHTPERRSDAVLERWPAHLHIDLMPRLQGKGLGRRLIALTLDALRADGIRGLHLAVDPRNAAAQEFYPKVGLTRQPDDFEPGVVLFTVDL